MDRENEKGIVVVAENPYAPPRGTVGVGRTQDRWDWRGLAVWAILFALNLIVPLMLGWYRVDRNGRFGVILGVLMLGGAGCGILVARPKAVSAAVVGAAVIAASQLVPILQVVAGAFGLGMVKALWPDVRIEGDFDSGIPGTDLGLPQGLLATLGTGTVLLACSAAIGGVYRVLGRMASQPARPDLGDRGGVADR